jgi:SAM-dependent methyltransferase
MFASASAEQVAMAPHRILQASWYDYPRYYDIAFQAYTQHEADFIEAACRKYCRFRARRLLEPACGTGRLITELATRGYQMTGFDLSQPALRYLRRRLTRGRLYAEIFEAEMSNFRIGQPADAAYCVLNTFRYLLAEQAARGHLECIAGSLRPGGIYVLGLHVLPLGGDKEDSDCWTQRRRETKVSVTGRVRTERRRRIEDVQLCLMAHSGSKELRLQHAFQLRTYTPRQFRRLLDSVPSLELCDVYDFRYDIAQPFAPNNEMAYSVFVLRRRRPA